MNQPLPLFVDLDGTLIKEDIGQLSLKDQIKKNFFICFVVIFKFIFFGKPNVKLYVSKNYLINFHKIHFNQACLDFINSAKVLGRKIYLISGSHQLLINQFESKLDIFDGHFGTSENYNMIGLNKVKFINEFLKISKFDYIGNSHQDLDVWENSENIIYTNVDESLLTKIQNFKQNKIFIKAHFIKK
jgi:hypothetical protein|tara:strand:- start:164 stop:724 length:561 start_codon:yes stop_codon:yes gene_type:complete